MRYFVSRLHVLLETHNIWVISNANHPPYFVMNEYVLQLIHVFTNTSTIHMTRSWNVIDSIFWNGPAAATREVNNLQVGHGSPVREQDKLTWAPRGGGWLFGYAEETVGSPTDRKRAQPNGSNKSQPVGASRTALPTICARDRPESQPPGPATSPAFPFFLCRRRRWWW
jgi:hypothetical protein